MNIKLQLMPMIVYLTLAIMVSGGMWYMGIIEEDNAKLMSNYFGIIIGAFITSVNFHVSSSAGSARKTEITQEQRK